MISSTRSDHSIDAILHGMGNQHVENNHQAIRRRRSRTIFPLEAVRRMEEEFEINRYPDIRKREAIAAEIGVLEARVQVWFQNRRARCNKRQRPADMSPDVANVCKRQRVEPSSDDSNDAMVCRDERMRTVTSRPDTHLRASSMHRGIQNPLVPTPLHFMYQQFVLQALRASRQLQPEVTPYKPETNTDDAKDIVNHLFRFSTSGSRGQQEVGHRQQKQIYRMVVPTKKTTDCSVTELRASDCTRVYREEMTAFAEQV